LKKVPASENAFAEFDIRKIKGYQDFYRIAGWGYTGSICRIQDGVLIFYRVKSREEIYGIFPLKALHHRATGRTNRSLLPATSAASRGTAAPSPPPSSGGIPRLRPSSAHTFITACSP